MLPNNLTREKGFTLIEVLVVVSIIALLFTVLFASFSQARARARDSKRIQDILEIKKALELYYAANGKYPPIPPVNVCSNRSYDYYRLNMSCWECNLEDDQFYDQNRLEALRPYLNPRPSSWFNGERFSNDYNKEHLGYWYKVSGSQKDYKLGLIGAIENANSVPESMRDNDWDTSMGKLVWGSNNCTTETHTYRPENINIAIYSSRISKNWSGETFVDDL